LLASLCAGAIAQTTPHPAFEAASIKPSAPDAHATIIALPPGGRVEIGYMTLKEMIGNAWHIQPYQISGGPAWMDSVHYDISAKAGANIKRDEVFVMLQSLLADRFHMVFRREVRQLPVYALVMARKDGKPGPKLIESKAGGCTQPDPVNPFAVDPMRLCGNFEAGPEGLTLVGAPISTAVTPLSRVLGRPVLDKTGLTKNFDIKVEWVPDETIAMKLPAGVVPDHPSGPSIFTVFREQLGIAFQSEKGPVDVFIVERAEKPSAN
jgi:uncharacterized protein (TIGR03435 family)